MSERTVWVVYKGHRDYEQNVAVCETADLAAEFMAERGADLWFNDHFKCWEFVGLTEGNLKEPWGAVEVPLVSR